MQKGINNRSKIDAKSKPEKRPPGVQKCNQNGTKIAFCLVERAAASVPLS
jgi:hypothetical protein